jgi:hypothetical protein
MFQLPLHYYIYLPFFLFRYRLFLNPVVELDVLAVVSVIHSSIKLVITKAHRRCYGGVVVSHQMRYERLHQPQHDGPFHVYQHRYHSHPLHQCHAQCETL